MERVGKEEEITEVAVRRNTTTASETPGAKAPVFDGAERHD